MLRKLSSTFRVTMAFAFAVLSSGLLPMYASAYVAPTEPVDKITICHANNGVKKYSTTPVNVSAISNLQNGNGHGTDKGTHVDDIIPPFTNTKGESYPGKNWDADSQLIYENNCNIPNDSNETDYCNPAPASGSVANWVPNDINCVEFSVAATCGQLTASITNLTQYTTWGIAYSEGAPDWNYTNLLPESFPEDYNGGSVDIYYWLVGPEEDYIVDRGIYNYWEKSAGKVTVDTDCLTDEEVYCNPANKPAGISIAQWIPDDLKCVEYTVATTCGQATATITKNFTPYTYAVAWSEDSSNIGTDNLLPTSFPEDYNSGDVDVHYWLVGPEGDYAKNRGMHTYWDNSYGTLTVDTNCQDDEIPLPSGIADVCGVGNDTVPDQNTQYYIVKKDTGWTQDGSDPVKKVRTVTYEANAGYKFPQSAGWTVSQDGKTASYTYTDWGTPCTVICETKLPLIHATNLNPNGWTLGTGAQFVDGGMKLNSTGNWNESTITRTMSGNLSALGNVIDFLPNQNYLGLHVETSAGTLVYEKYYENQNPANAGKWWSKSGFGVSGGQGYATFDTLDSIIAANPLVTLKSLTVLYTSPVEASSTVTNVQIGCNEYTFDHVDEPTTPVDEPEIPVLGTDTDEPRVAGEELPEVLPQTGVVDSRTQLIAVLLAGLLTYGAMYFTGSRREDIA